MIADHHIQTQRIVLAADTLSAASAGKWHRRLESLQDTTLLPALERQLDRLCPRGETIVLERVEVVLPIETVEQLEREVPAVFSQELRLALQKAVNAAPVRTPTLRLLNDFLRSGRFDWQAGEARAFGERIVAEAKHWTADEWDGFFRFLASDFSLFFWRLTQVQGKFPRQALAQLHKLADDRATRAFSPAVPSEQAKQAWQRLLPLAGYGKPTEGTPPSSSPIREKRPKVTAPTATPQPVAEYFPPNAGLVILHPYLGYLAKETACWQNEVLDHHRLAALLHYAVSGNEPFLEWEQPLTKILLGLPLETPLLPVILTDADREAVDELLRGIIGHWSILGNTSPDGLRGGFLQRPGKLYATPGGWQLLVENRGHDLLLAHLPWSINLVKSPWMAQMLQVSWS